MRLNDLNLFKKDSSSIDNIDRLRRPITSKIYLSSCKLTGVSAHKAYEKTGKESPVDL